MYRLIDHDRRSCKKWRFVCVSPDLVLRRPTVRTRLPFFTTPDTGLVLDFHAHIQKNNHFLKCVISPPACVTPTIGWQRAACGSIESVWCLPSLPCRPQTARVARPLSKPGQSVRVGIDRSPGTVHHLRDKTAGHRARGHAGVTMPSSEIQARPTIDLSKYRQAIWGRGAKPHPQRTPLEFQ
jgi:hypothetical protein